MTCSTRNTKCVIALVAAAATFTPALARAQDPEAAALFTTAKDLAAKGQWAEACPKFEVAQKKEPALGTLMNLADCHEHTSALFRAWGEWRLAYEQAKKASDDARADLAKRRADALEPRLPKLKVVVTGLQSDLSVWRDDKQLDSAEYNTELPIDPGAHAVTVRRGAATIETSKVDSKEKAHDSVSFDLDKIAKDHPAPVEAGATNSGAGSTKTDTKGGVVQTNTVVVNGQQQPASTPTGRVVANIFLGVGLTAAVLGGAFIGVAAGITGDKGSCTQLAPASGGNPASYLCPGNTAANIGTGQTLATVGQWALVGGATFVVTAIVLYIFVPKGEKPPNAQVGFTPLPGGGAFSFARAF